MIDQPLEEFVGSILQRLNASAQHFVREGLRTTPEMAFLSSEEFEELTTMLDDDLQRSCTFHRTIAVHTYPGKGVSEQAISDLSEQQFVELTAVCIFEQAAVTFKTKRHPGGAVLQIANRADIPEDRERRALEALTTVKPLEKPPNTWQGAFVAGYIFLPEALTEPIQRSIIIVSPSFQMAPLQVTMSVRRKVHPIFSLDASVLEAFSRWMDGEEFTILPPQTLNAVDINGVARMPDSNPWLLLFLGKSFAHHARFVEAATLYLSSFVHENMHNEGAFEVIDEIIKNKRGMSLLELCNKTSREEVQEVIAEILRERHATQQKTLERARAREQQRVVVPKLSCQQAEAFVRDRCSHLRLSDEQLQLLLFYADGLCIRQFGQRLFEAQVRAADQGLIFDESDTIAATSIQPEHERLLNAVVKIAENVSKIALQDLLHKEGAWMASGPDDVLTDRTLTFIFRGCVPQSPMFDQVSRLFSSEGDSDSPM